MRAQLDRTHRRADKLPFLRRYGYGVPNLSVAKFSALNDVTLIAEDDLQPFWMHDGRVKTRHMNLYRLPWPVEELQALGETEVHLRVTLSYFVEPNPGERGWTRRHRYASHGLRFAMKRSTEGLNDFRARINRAVELDETAGPLPEDEQDNWYLGKLRDAGSIHSDHWRGTGADLATRDALAVFPVSGWWKEKPALERYERRTRYSLLISIRLTNAADVYTPVRLAIRVPVPVVVR